MKAAIYQKFGKPAEVLEVMDVEDPIMDDHSIRVRVLFANINYSDVITIKGEYGVFPSLPSRAGIEGVGLVLETGRSADEKIRPGERVCFHSRSGAWAEIITVKSDDIIPLPDQIDLYTGAQFFTNPLTADVMVSTSGARPGDIVLINAAGSAIGKLLVQFALLAKMIPIAVVRNDSTREFLQNTGLKFIINSEKENLIRKVREFSNGKGINVAFDAVAGKLSSELVQSMAEGGKIIVYGALSKERIPLNASQLIFRDITIKGFWLAKWLRSFSEERKDVLRSYQNALIDKMIGNDIHMPVTATYPLEDIRQAVTHFETPGRAGKILVNLQ